MASVSRLHRNTPPSIAAPVNAITDAYGPHHRRRTHAPTFGDRDPNQENMHYKDVHGHQLTGANAASVDHFERGCALFRCYVGDPLAEAQAAVAAAPDMSMAHVLAPMLREATRACNSR